MIATLESLVAYPFQAEFDAARYPPGYLRTGITEAQVQCVVLEVLRLKGALAFPVDAGARLLRGRAAGALRRAGASRPERLLAGQTGAGFAGLADVIGILPGGRALFVEVKAPAWMTVSPKTGRLVQKRRAGEPSEAQLRFLADAASWGAVAGVVWSTRDLDALIPGGAP